MPDGRLYKNMFDLASQFPPSVNTEDDPTTLKPYESPACYGVSCTSEGRLRTGTIPTGTTRNAPTKTISTIEYAWLYNRLWLASGTTLKWGAPRYDDIYLPHGLGKVQLGEGVSILAVLPAFGNQLWLITTAGSYFITNAKSIGEEEFEPSQYVQELVAPAAENAMTLNGQPIVSNSGGVFLWDGNSVKELTKSVRSTLGSFTTAPIKADYLNQRIVGTSKYAIDVLTGKLFDYGTSGFLYTTPTMAQPRGYEPFTVNSIVIAFELSSAGSATISWQSKAEDDDWFTESDIEIVADTNTQSRIEVAVGNDNRTAHKMAFRLTGLSSNVSIRSIQVNVVGMAVESGGK